MNQTKRAAANEQIAAKNPNAQPIEEAVKILKSFKGPRFDQSVEVCVHLGIDPRQADQQLRGSIAMPRGVGKTARVICFCGPDKAEDAKAAGAAETGGEELIERIQGGWMDFDVAVASPDMMRMVSKLGKILGPKGLMPSPKAGTVTPDVAKAVAQLARTAISSTTAGATAFIDRKVRPKMPIACPMRSRGASSTARAAPAAKAIEKASPWTTRSP